jgi:hypothetical protein
VSQIVRIVRQVSGVGVDADAVTLRNQANTAAITRVRDGAIIVTPAQANAVESVGDGAYEYDVEPHALDPSESYLIWFYFVAAGYSDRFESETIQAADTSRTRRWLGGGHIRPDADVGVLELDVPFSTDDETFWLEVARPDKRWIKSGGAWGSSNVGLQAEDDEALADPRLVTEFVLAFAFEALIGQAADDAEARHWEKAAATQHTKAAALRSELLDKLDRSGRGVGKRPRVQNTARWVSRIPSRRFGR